MDRTRSFKTPKKSNSPTKRNNSPLDSMPTLQLSDVKMDSEELLKPRSNRDVDQGHTTIFKIEAPLWNNVPGITYEAIVKIISEIDAMKKREISSTQTLK